MRSASLRALAVVISRRPPLRTVWPALAMCALVLGCGAAAPPKPTIAPPKPAPSVVTDATFDEALRHFSLLAFDDPGRESLRARLIDHLLEKSTAVKDGDYHAVVELVAQVTDLYTPSELNDGKLPAALEPAARYLVQHGSPKGDEARVLAALLILHQIHPDDAAITEQYQKLKEWGFDARAALSSPLDRFEEGIVEVWEEHARLMPMPEVLSTLAKLYVERRNALVALWSERRAPLSAPFFESAQHAGMSVAAVYLRFGDIATALANLQAMGPPAGSDQRLIELLQTAREPGSDGSGALLDLARHYLEDGHPEVSRALCLNGMRDRSDDARFPQCLARIAATRNDFSGAMAWYAEAVRLMPEERSLYDEILEVLNSLMEQGLFGSDTVQTRAIANRAAEILEERIKRWPDSPPPVKPEDLYLAIGVAEMNAGNARDAEARLRKSLAAKETIGGLLQLGLLLERMNRSSEAAELYRRALQVTANDHGEDEPRRAEILERLGDALRMLGQQQEASKMYEQGLSIWDRNLSRQKGQRIGSAHVRRGVLLGRLSRRNDSLSAFEKAMALAPEVRETYATILAYLAVSEPDSRFAHQVFHNALNQLSLEPEWKVYFALWLRMIAGRGGQSVDSEVNAVFEDLSQGDDWWSQLARFAQGKLDFAALFGVASDLGERTEAYFYEGARRLGSGDVSGAREMFKRVLESNMVNFYEFAMAQELVATTAPSQAQAAGPAAAVQAQVPAAPAK